MANLAVGDQQYPIFPVAAFAFPNTHTSTVVCMDTTCMRYVLNK